jgi:acyl-coenzyme A thioesterase PaaI-like protein
MSFADSLGGAAAFVNLPDGARGTTTLESKTNFVAGAPSGPTLVGRCALIRRSALMQRLERSDTFRSGGLSDFDPREGV